MTPKLTVMILHLEGREGFFYRLIEKLTPQLNESVQVLISHTKGNLPIGAEREAILQEAKGDYVCFIDDDDLVAPNYIEAILASLEEKPDCVGFKVARLVDGEYQSSREHSRRLLTINHLNPVRRELAQRVGFKAWNENEDRDYADRLAPLLQSERFIDSALYEYHYRTDRNNERVNLEGVDPLTLKIKSAMNRFRR